MKTARTTKKKGANKNGSKWIRAEKRLRIYARDDFICAYCGRPVFSVALVEQMRCTPCPGSEPATLDHIRPRSKGGSNHESNLVTACLSCNSARQDKPWTVFAEAKGGKEAVNRIRRNRKRALPSLQEVLEEV